MKKRVVSFLLACVMVLSICLTGCGDKETTKESSKTSESKTESTSEKTEESTVPEELEEATVQIWLGGPGKQKDADKVNDAFNELLKEYLPNTTVEFEHIAMADYLEKFNQMLASGEAVDLVWTGTNWTTGDTAAHIQDGNFLPLTDMLDKYGAAIYESMGENRIAVNKVDGELYYIPSIPTNVAGSYALRIPTELAKVAGDTWLEDTQAVIDAWWNDPEGPDVDGLNAFFDQFEIYFSALKAADKLYSGLDTEYWLNGWYFHALGFSAACAQLQNYGIGVQYMDDDMTVIDGYAGEYFQTYAERMADFYEKGYIRSDVMSVPTSELDFVSNGTYTANTTVTRMHTLTASKETIAAQETAARGTDISVLKIEAQPYVQRGWGTAMAVPYCADEAERAIMVLNAIFEHQDLRSILIYGIEGEHYTDNGDGTITTPYVGNATPDVAYGIYSYIIADARKNLITQSDIPGQQEEGAALEEASLISPFTDFNFDQSKVSGALSAISAVDTEYKTMVQNGVMGADWRTTYDKWMAERKAAGVDDVVAELQAQLDAYIEANNITNYWGK